METSVKKRKRTVLTARQQKILAKSFEECAFPDAEQRIELGKSLNMTPRAVQIWFKNKKQKIKSNNQDQIIENSSKLMEITRRSSFNKSLAILSQISCLEYAKKAKKNKH
jgi:hypothetical protein